MRKSFALTITLAATLFATESSAIRCHNVVFAVSAAKGDLAQVKKCIQERRDPNQIDDMGSRPIIQAARKGHTSIVQFLLKNGADPNKPDKSGDTAIQFAQKKGKNYTIITALLMNYGANPNYVNSWGSTPLIDAVRNGLQVNTILLLEHGKVKAKANIFVIKGQTPLWYAVRKGSSQATIVRILARNGANMNNYDKFGLTPLMRAVDKGHIKIARALVQNKANPNLRSKQKTQLTPLLLAVNADNNATKLIELLVQNGADINKGNHWGYTPLMRAASLEKVEALRKLLLLGADESRRTKNGATALTYAKKTKNPEILKLLNIETTGDLENELLSLADETAQKLSRLR